MDERELCLAKHRKEKKELQGICVLCCLLYSTVLLRLKMQLFVNYYYFISHTRYGCDYPSLVIHGSDFRIL